MHYISFPGLGIEPFEINKVCFSLFGKDVYWYGVLIAVGMILGFIYACSRAKFEKIKIDDMFDFAIISMISAILGARLYYVIFSLNDIDYIYSDGSFFENIWKSFVNIIAIWNGGLAIYGGVIGGLIAVILVAKHKKIKAPVILDVFAPGLLIGQIVGRWGNFFNAEAFGYSANVESLFCRMGISETENISSYYHPTFLYESLWNLIGFLLIAIFYKKKKYNGEVFLFYIA